MFISINIFMYIILLLFVRLGINHHIILKYIFQNTKVLSLGTYNKTESLILLNYVKYFFSGKVNDLTGISLYLVISSLHV